MSEPLPESVHMSLRVDWALYALLPLNYYYGPDLTMGWLNPLGVITGFLGFVWVGFTLMMALVLWTRRAEWRQLRIDNNTPIPKIRVATFIPIIMFILFILTGWNALAGIYGGSIILFHIALRIKI